MLDCNTQGVCLVRNMPLLSQSDWRIDNDVESKMGPAGCYDACITTAAITALANRNPGSITPTGRSAEFDAIKGEVLTSGAVIPKEIKQLSWAYRKAMIHQEAAKKPENKGKPIPQPYYLHELIADCHEIQQGCDPRTYGNCAIVTNAFGAAFRDWIGEETHLTNEYLQDLIQAGFAVIIAFYRFQPTATQLPSGKWKVTFDHPRASSGNPQPSPHKVVASGFQPGGYPLLINDVGDGQRRSAKLVSGMWSRPFGSSAATGGSIEQVEFRPQWSGSRRTYLEYSGANGPADNAFFIEHVDAVSLEWQPPRQVWWGRWGAGWTSFMPFTMGKHPCFIAYNATTGEVHFDRVAASLNGSETAWAWHWGTGWSSFMPFIPAPGAGPHYLVYNAATGEVHIDRIRADLQGPVSVWAGRWGTGWSHFVPFGHEGRHHFIAYNASTGLVHIDRLHTALNGSETRWEGGWGTGWTDFVPFDYQGRFHFIAYNANTGLVHIDRLWPGLNGSEGRAVGDWATGWQLTKVLYSGMPHYTAYNRRTGSLHFDRLNSNAQGSSTIWNTTISPRDTHAMPFKLAGKSYQLRYDTQSGSATFHRFTPL
jgi:hypothetical protein